jgi:hypothetical protein
MTGNLHEEQYTLFYNISLIFFFFWNNVEKYGIGGQDTDDNMAHAFCMLDT